MPRPMPRLKRFFAACALAGLVTAVTPAPASAHECMKHPRHDGFHDKGRHKGGSGSGHCRA
ncbi:MAG: hypothetical protein ACRDKW_14305 [Actinomycetota bacterium]